jgi:two-component sensor histidine kinase
MDDDAARVRKLLRQQAAIAGFGSFALRESDLMKILTEAARACADGLDVHFSKVCRYREAERDLLIEAGHGWKAGVVGNVVSRADETSPQGRAFITGEPSICNDLAKDDRFVLPPFYAEHGIVSTIDVVIKGSDDQPYGVLEIDNDEQHDYDQPDIDFLTAFANVLAEAVATSVRTGLLETTIAQMKGLVEDKDRLLDRMKVLAEGQDRLVGQMKVLADDQNRLLDQKKVLAEELQHRVRNNLQLVYGMLSKQLDDTTDAAGQRGIKAIARRVSTLAQVYDHLLGTEMTRTTDFGGYVRSLCLNLAEIQATSRAAVKMTCDSETLVLDLDVVTALGIVVAELVTNSYDHAFPAGKGAINVSARRAAEDVDSATITIRDNGTGFTVKAGSKRHGLGLVRRLVEQIQGTLAVASDQGTVWTIKFPLVLASEPVAPAI